MRRLARYALTAFSAVSLLLCVATCALWARSHSVGESLGRMREWGQWEVDLSRGMVSAYHERIVNPDASYLNATTADGSELFDLRRESDPAPSGAIPPWWRSSGADIDVRFGRFRITRHEGTGSAWQNIIWYAAVPCHVLALLLSIPPSIRLLLWARSRRRTKAGHCPACGYDCRATPDRCPECGAAHSAAV